MLAEGLLDTDYYTNATQKHTLTIAQCRRLPVDIFGGVRIDRHDLCSTHEEAVILITQHAILLSVLGKSVRVVCTIVNAMVTMLPQ